MSSSRPRVFVSSVMQGFEDYREAARAGIVEANAEAVMAEDWTSRPDSSRTACLDMVASSDAFVLVVGARGGWRAPSGKLVVEEEWEEAQRRKLPARVFVQEGVTPDPDAASLIASVSDYIHGRFRRTFTDPASLTAEVARALADVAALPVNAMTLSSADLRRHALAVGGQTNHTGRPGKTLRFVLAPKRGGEVIEPQQLDDRAFHHQVMTAATHPEHAIVTYGQRVAPRVERTALVLEAPAPETWHEARAARVEVHERGLLLVDTPLDAPPRNDLGRGTIPEHVLDANRVENALTTAFRFAGAVYDLVDPYRRHERFLVDVALDGVRANVLERDPQPRGSYTIPFEWGLGRQDGETPLMLLDGPRTIGRDDLARPDAEVGRLMAYLQRELRT